MIIQRRLFHLESETIVTDIVKNYLCEDGIYHYSSGNPEKIDFLKEVSLASTEVLLLAFNLNESIRGNCSMLNICKYVSEHFPSIRIIAHSEYSAKGHFVELIKAGVSAIVSKSAGWCELKQALQDVAKGKHYIEDGHDDIFVNVHRFVAGEKGKIKYDRNLFSTRESQVLNLVAQGYRTCEIAESLFITTKTVETHRKSLVVKSSTKNTAEMIHYSHSHGLL